MVRGYFERSKLVANGHRATAATTKPFPKFKTFLTMTRGDVIELLLRSNDCHFPHEEQQVRSILLETQSQLDMVERKIEVLQAVLDTLCDQKTLLKSRIRRQKMALAPIRKIPAELIAEIFLLAVAEATAISPNGQSYSSAANTVPLRLSHVCRSWRETALFLQPLWTHLYLSSDQKHGSEILQTWLDRSGQRGLYFHVKLTSRPTHDRQNLVQSLIAHSHRWHTMHLYANGRTLACFGVIRGHLPLLTEVKLAISNPEDIAGSVTDIFADAPLLRSFHISSQEFWRTTPIFQVPWNQLNAYSVDDAGIHDCIQYLNQAPNLAECRLLSRFAPVIPTVMVVHEHLRSLSLCDYRLLNHLHASQLEELEVKWMSQEIYPLYQAIEDFVARSSSNLTHFTLCEWNRQETAILASEIIPVFQVLPNIISLTLRNFVWNDDLFPPLTISSNQSIILPKMQDLHLDLLFSHLQPRTRSRPERLLDMIESRCTVPSGVVRLNTVFLRLNQSLFDSDCSGYSDEEQRRMIYRINILKEVGMKIEIV
ncbi:uncharacterized protein EV420DRAFT_58650 [Desarmillaria tabescens]|uniref:F-box domain-containing protein n=1 Tax=Armillaria tabescens TaxID=1929756 RepID=A0AA39NQK7_ARMTA|nr:uncharacterized protein EV420DRAFT_58650 [Desarmillaria tabescens]KAK0469718.1 hypothetical protein EV420DRAFT_58650 [Desarmillaria tabescens]